MPFTPFHFGPGAAIHSAAPRRISFLAFCTANVLIDVEPAYYMLTDNPPLHRFLHTYIGATIVAVLTILLFLACQWFAKRFWLPNVFEWRNLTLSPVVAGAAVGTYTHIALDSIMHSDIRPLAPFSDRNPLLGILSISELEWACVVSGVIGVAVLAGGYISLRMKGAR